MPEADVVENRHTGSDSFFRYINLNTSFLIKNSKTGGIVFQIFTNDDELLFVADKAVSVLINAELGLQTSLCSIAVSWQQLTANRILSNIITVSFFPQMWLLLSSKSNPLTYSSEAVLSIFNLS